MKPHIKVIQRNGVDIFVTSSMEMKPSEVIINYSYEENHFNEMHRNPNLGRWEKHFGSKFESDFFNQRVEAKEHETTHKES